MPTQRFDGRDLDDALAKARSEIGEAARVVNAERIRSGGLGGFFARERVEIEVEVEVSDQPPEGPPTSLLDLADLVSEAEHLSATAVVDRGRVDAVAALTGARQKERAPARPPVSTEPPLRPAVSTESQSFAEILDRITAEAAPAAATAPAATAPAATAPAATAPAAGAVVPAPPPPPLAALAELGLPNALIPTSGDVRQSLLQGLAALPAPPPLPSSRGTVVAVVGPRGGAQEVARSLCATLGTDPSTVTTVTPRRRRGSTGTELTTAQEAEDHRRSWRRRPRPTVAVVETALGRSTEWAAAVLEALEPSVVWGLVDATRKVEDICAWAEGLGGLDALCVDGVEDTVSPAAPLATGVPVVMLQGEPATAERWADLLLARIGA